MPELKDVRETKTIKLLSFEGGEITLYTDFLYRDMRKLEKVKDNYQKGIETFLVLAKEWNLTDSEGNVLEITEKNLEMFPRKDLMYVFDEVGKIFDETKKEGKKNLKS